MFSTLERNIVLLRNIRMRKQYSSINLRKYFLITHLKGRGRLPFKFQLNTQYAPRAHTQKIYYINLPDGNNTNNSKRQGIITNLEYIVCRNNIIIQLMVCVCSFPSLARTLLFIIFKTGRPRTASIGAGVCV